MKKTLTSFAAVTVLALGLSACGFAEGDATPTDENGNMALSIGNFLDITSWDPSLADIGFDGPYLSAVYDPLLTVDDEGEPQPGLATDWTVSDDFKTITMDLRTDVKFSDGEEFDAEAAVKSLDYLKDGVRSQEAYQKVKDFEVVDDDTIAIHLKQRDDTILYFMGLGRSYMMAPDAIEAGTLAKEPVGSGPYTLAETSVAGSQYEFDKVADHWAAEEFPFDPLKVSPVSDPAAMLNGLQGQQFNVIYGDQTAIEQSAENDWNHSEGLASWVGLQFNDRDGDDFEPLGDKKVRQALNYAFDGAGMLTAVGRDLGVDTNQVFPSETTGSLADLNDTYATNMDTAKKLLAEAGYADGFEVTMPMAQPFQAWQPNVNDVFKELGITVKWDDYQFADYMGNVENYPMFIANISMDSNAVATVERQITEPQWYNPNPDLEAFPDIEAQTKKVFTADPGEAQNAEIEKLNTMITDEAWFSVWYQAKNAYISTSDFTVSPVTGTMFPGLRHISIAD